MPPGALPILTICFMMWLIALLGRVQDRSWTSPSSIFALIWAAYIPTLLFFVPDAQPYIKGMLWILVSVVAVALGSAIAGMVFPRLVTKSVIASPVTASIVAKLTIIGIIVGLMDAGWLFVARGVALQDILSFKALMLVSAANRGEAYAGELETPVFERVAFTMIYLGTLYGGVLFRLTRRRSEKVLAVVALLVLILINTLHGSRFGSIYGGAFWLSAYLAATVALSDPVRSTGSAFLLRFALAGVVIVFVFSMLTMTVRYNVFADVADNPAARVGWAYMLSDPFGFVAAFGIWFNDAGLHDSAPMYGARVFRRIAGLWGKSYPLYDAIDVGFNTSNVYTIFRELIDDFTWWGSLEMLLFYGFAARFIFWRTTLRISRVGLPLLAIAYIFAFTGVASSAFAYTTITAALILFVASFVVLPPVGLPRTRKTPLAASKS
jgi:oligosaccharide repeat unit polymerase